MIITSKSNWVYKEISISLVLIMFVFTSVVSAEIRFLLLSLYVLYNLIMSHYIPSINMLKYIIAYFVLCTFAMLFSGFFTSYTFRDILRDAIYVLAPLVCILAGYFWYRHNSEFVSIYKTLAVYCVTMTIIGIVTSIGSVGAITSMYSLRDSGLSGAAAIDIRYFLVIYMFYSIYNQRKMFSGIINWIILGVLVFSLIVQFSRTGYVIAIVSILICVCFIPRDMKNDASVVKKLLLGLLMIIILMYTLSVILPDAVISEFIDKIIYSNDEVTTTISSWNGSEASQYWRSYEISCAWEEFSNGSILNQLFGYGFGKLITADYAYLVGGSGAIATLHNGFYTALVKGGLLGVLLLILTFISPIKEAVYCCKNGEMVFENTVLLVVIAASIVRTFGTMGIFNIECDYVACILIGMIYACKYIYWEEVNTCEVYTDIRNYRTD